MGVRLSLGQHVPNDVGHPPHDGHPSNARTLLAFDFFKPRLHHRVRSQDVPAGLAEHPPGDATTGFGDVAQSLFITAVARTGSQSKVIG